MRKAVVLLLILAVLLCACSQANVTASAKAVSVGKQAVEAIDAYLDGSATSKETGDKLSELARQLSYTSDYAGTNMTDQQRSDWYIKTDIDLAGHDIIMDNYNGTPETYDEIVKQRNEIAELVGVDKR